MRDSDRVVPHFQEQLATLMRLTERYCVVYQTLANPPSLAVTRQRAPA